MDLQMYVDGSFTKGMDHVSGAIIILNKNNPLIVQRVVSKKEFFVQSMSDGGELLSMIVGLPMVQNLAKGEDVKLDVYFDYKGIEKFVRGPQQWRPQKPVSQLYVYTYNKVTEACPNLNVVFHKVRAHSGVYWNEMADTIAKGFVPGELSVAFKGEIEI